MEKKQIIGAGILAALVIGGGTYFLLSQQNQVLVSGVAHRQSDQGALAGETITIRKNNQKVTEVKTDKNGYFHVRLDPKQTYSFEGKGFRATLKAEDQKKIDVQVQNGNFILGHTEKTETGEVTLAPSVVALPAQNYQLDSEKKVIYFDQKQDLKPGETFYLPSQEENGVGTLHRVKEIKSNDKKSAIQFEEVKDDQVTVAKIQNKESVSLKDFGFTPAVGVEVLSDGKSSDIQIEYKDKNGLKAQVTLAGKVDVDLDWKEADSDSKVLIQPNLVTKTNLEFQGKKGTVDKELGTLPLVTKSGVEIPVKIHLTFTSDGEASIKATAEDVNRGKLSLDKDGLELGQDESHHTVLDGQSQGVKLEMASDIQLGYGGSTIMDFKQTSSASLTGKSDGKVDVQVSADKQSDDQFATGTLDGKGNVHASASIAYSIPSRNLKDQKQIYDLNQAFDKLKATSNESDYKDVLKRYQTYFEMSKNRSANLTKYMQMVGQYPYDEGNASREFMDNSPEAAYYALYDIDGDGRQELFFSVNKQSLLAAYYLKDKEGTVIGSSGAYTGGARADLKVLKDKTIIQRYWTSGRGEGREKFMKLSDSGLQVESEKDFSLRDQPNLMQEWKKEDQVDLASLDWKNLADWKDDESSAKSESKEVTKSQTGMNLKELEAGNFSSIAGTWRRADGHTLTFDANGLVSDTQEIGTPNYNQSYPGYLISGIVSKPRSPGGALVAYLPAGTAYNMGPFQDQSDTSKERLWVGNGIAVEDKNFYYKVN